MILRGLIVALGLMLAPAVQAAAADPVAHVRTLYEREIARNAGGDPMPPAEFDALFIPEVRKLRAAPPSPAASVVAGPKLHVFFGWGMLPGAPVTLRNAGGAGGAGQAVVIVDLTVRGVRRSVIVHLFRDGDTWLIGNIMYDRGDDLLTFLRKLSGTE